RLVCVGDHQLIGGDEGEAACLEIAFLSQGKQVPQELFVALEHFLKFHHSPVGDVQFAVKPVSPGIRFGSVGGDGGEIDASGQFGNVLGFGIGGGEGADAHT